MYYSFRATMKVLKTYITSRGIKTLNDIISSYVTTQDGNNLEAYIRHASDITGRDRGFHYEWKENYIDDIARLVHAITFLECSENISPAYLKQVLLNEFPELRKEEVQRPVSQIANIDIREINPLNNGVEIYYIESQDLTAHC